jgi:hypothetical protein
VQTDPWYAEEMLRDVPASELSAALEESDYSESGDIEMSQADTDDVDFVKESISDEEYSLEDDASSDRTEQPFARRQLRVALG